MPWRGNHPDLSVTQIYNVTIFDEPGYKLDEQGIATLRKKGYTFYTQVDQHAYAPVLGSAVSGFSMLAGLQMNEFHRELHKIHSYVNEHKTEVKELLSKNSGIPLTSLNFTLSFKDWTFYVYEINSRQFVNFDLTGYNPHAPKEGATT